MLAGATVRGDSIRVLRQEPFEMLVSFVLSQREPIPAIRTTVREPAEAYGEATEVPSGKTTFLSLRPEILAGSFEESLRSLGLGYRAPYALDTARHVADGRLDLDVVRGLPGEEFSAELQSVHGVREKVADCVMPLGYGRTERVPSDVWVQRIVSEGYQGMDPLIVRKRVGILQ